MLYHHIPKYSHTQACTKMHIIYMCVTVIIYAYSCI